MKFNLMVIGILIVWARIRTSVCQGIPEGTTKEGITPSEGRRLLSPLEGPSPRVREQQQVQSPPAAASLAAPRAENPLDVVVERALDEEETGSLARNNNFGDSPLGYQLPGTTPVLYFQRDDEGIAEDGVKPIEIVILPDTSCETSLRPQCDQAKDDDEVIVGIPIITASTSNTMLHPQDSENTYENSDIIEMPVLSGSETNQQYHDLTSEERDDIVEVSILPGCNIDGTLHVRHQEVTPEEDDPHIVVIPALPDNTSDTSLKPRNSQVTYEGDDLEVFKVSILPSEVDDQVAVRISTETDATPSTSFHAQELPVASDREIPDLDGEPGDEGSEGGVSDILDFILSYQEKCHQASDAGAGLERPGQEDNLGTTRAAYTSAGCDCGGACSCAHVDTAEPLPPLTSLHPSRLPRPVYNAPPQDVGLPHLQPACDCEGACSCVHFFTAESLPPLTPLHPSSPVYHAPPQDVGCPRLHPDDLPPFDREAPEADHANFWTGQNNTALPLEIILNESDVPIDPLFLNEHERSENDQESMHASLFLEDDKEECKDERSSAKSQAEEVIIVDDQENTSEYERSDAQEAAQEVVQEASGTRRKSGKTRSFRCKDYVCKCVGCPARAYMKELASPLGEETEVIPSEKAKGESVLVAPTLAAGPPPPVIDEFLLPPRGYFPRSGSYSEPLVYLTNVFDAARYLEELTDDFVDNHFQMHEGIANMLSEHIVCDVEQFGPEGLRLYSLCELFNILLDNTHLLVQTTRAVYEGMFHPCSRICRIHLIDFRHIVEQFIHIFRIKNHEEGLSLANFYCSIVMENGIYDECHGMSECMIEVVSDIIVQYRKLLTDFGGVTCEEEDPLVAGILESMFLCILTSLEYVNCVVQVFVRPLLMRLLELHNAEDIKNARNAK